MARHYVFRKDAITSSDLGWGSNYKSEENRDLSTEGPIAVERHTSDNFDMLFENIEALKSIIAFCKRENLKLILFTPPAYSTYVNNLNQEQIKLTVSTVNEIVKGDDSISYLNLLEEPSFTAEDFFDSDHLNEIGAEKLTRIISGYL